MRTRNGTKGTGAGFNTCMHLSAAVTHVEMVEKLVHESAPVLMASQIDRLHKLVSKLKYELDETASELVTW